MGGITKFERDVLTALEAARNVVPSFIETLVFNGVGAAASFEDFGDGWVYTALKAPTGYKGKVIGVSCYGVTEAFTATTLPSRVDVGNSTDAQAYYVGGSLGTTATTDAAHPAGTFKDYIPGGSSFNVKGVANTGGTPAGRSRIALTIMWVQE